jgi:hypothetical protein
MSQVNAQLAPLPEHAAVVGGQEAAGTPLTSQDMALVLLTAVAENATLVIACDVTCGQLALQDDGLVIASCETAGRSSPAPIGSSAVWRT